MTQQSPAEDLRLKLEDSDVTRKLVRTIDLLLRSKVESALEKAGRDGEYSHEDYKSAGYVSINTILIILLTKFSIEMWADNEEEYECIKEHILSLSTSIMTNIHNLVDSECTKILNDD